MIQGAVTRNDKIWQGHPDVAFFKDKLFVAFRESDSHATYGQTKIKLTSCPIKKKISKFQFDDPVTIAETSDRFNCPRLSVIDDHLYIICDEVKASVTYGKTENKADQTKIYLFKSEDGIEWGEPILTNITGIVPDKIQQAKNGQFLIATHTKIFSEDNINGSLGQHVWSSENLDGSWEQHLVHHNPDLNLCEASIVPINKQYLCLMRENSSRGLPSFFCKSKNGINWGDIQPTRMFGCHRPVCGVLRSGKLLTTYREATHSFKSGFWAKNTFACLTNPKSALSDFTHSVILPIDHDKSGRSDSGYTGWVQLPDDSIFVVNYITNDAPRPYIKWYLIREEEF